MSYKLKGDKIIINGVEQIITPGPLPSSPSNGYIAIDQTDSLLKVWNQTKNKWIPLDDFFNTPVGSLDIYTFAELGTATNEWLEYGVSSINSDTTQAILPFNANLIAVTFTNEKNDADTDIEIYRSPEGSGSSSSRVATFQVRNRRIARFSDFTTIQFNAGDKISVYLRDRGSNASDVVVKLYFLITSFNKQNSGESYSSSFSLSVGGITITLG